MDKFSVYQMPHVVICAWAVREILIIAQPVIIILVIKDKYLHVYVQPCIMKMERQKSVQVINNILYLPNF